MGGAVRMIEKKSGIYSIVCDKTWRSYVGSSCNLGDRYKSHISCLRGNKHSNKELQMDFNQFGESGLFFEIIEEVENSRLLEREKFWQNLGCNLYNIDAVYNILPTPTQDDIDRFWEQVDKTDNCWTIKNDKGKRPRFGYQNCRVHAARVAYKFSCSDFNDTMLVCHKCDNEFCVRPDHLFLGTSKDNVRDRINKGRGKISVNKLLVDAIRDEYLKDISKTSTQLKVWTKNNFGYKINTKTMRRILNNQIFTDENYKIDDRTNCKKPYKLNWNIVKEIREMYLNKTKFKQIQSFLFDKYQIKVCKPNISNIGLNEIWIDKNYVPIRRKKIKTIKGE
jgi:hypothetical protein